VQRLAEKEFLIIKIIFAFLKFNLPVLLLKYRVENKIKVEKSLRKKFED
jgi:hypothetical protein